MPRPKNHKQLVDALLDGEQEANEAALLAVDKGGRARAIFLKVSQRVLKARQAGKISSEEAQRLFQQAWMNLSIGSFANVAGHVKRAGDNFAKVRKIAEDMGEEKLKVSPITDIDRLEREQEKRNGEQEET